MGLFHVIAEAKPVVIQLTNRHSDICAFSRILRFDQKVITVSVIALYKHIEHAIGTDSLNEGVITQRTLKRIGLFIVFSTLCLAAGLLNDLDVSLILQLK